MAKTSLSALVHRRLNIFPDWCNHRWRCVVCRTAIVDEFYRKGYCRNIRIKRHSLIHMHSSKSPTATGAPSVYIIGSGAGFTNLKRPVLRKLSAHTRLMNWQLGDGSVGSILPRELLIIHLPCSCAGFTMPHQSQNGPAMVRTETGFIRRCLSRHRFRTKATRLRVATSQKR